MPFQGLVRPYDTGTGDISTSRSTQLDFSIYDDDNAQIHYNLTPNHARRVTGQSLKLPPRAVDLTDPLRKLSVKDRTGSFPPHSHTLPNRTAPTMNVRTSTNHLTGTTSIRMTRSAPQMKLQQNLILDDGDYLNLSEVNQSKSCNSSPTKTVGTPTSERSKCPSSDTTLGRPPTVVHQSRPPCLDRTSLSYPPNQKDFRDFSVKFISGSPVTETTPCLQRPTSRQSSNMVDRYDRFIDTCTCMVCIKTFDYHTNANDPDADDDVNPCSCAGSKGRVAKRWACMGALSILLPCLFCYVPLAVCRNGCKNRPKRSRRRSEKDGEEVKYTVKYADEREGTPL